MVLLVYLIFMLITYFILICACLFNNEEAYLYTVVSGSEHGVDQRFVVAGIVSLLRQIQAVH